MLDPRPPLLLVVEQLFEREQHRQLLEEHGFATHAVSSGRDGLEWLVSNHEQAGFAGHEAAGIVLVGSMARMGGWEFLETTRWYLRLAQIPALIVSEEIVGPWTRQAFRYLKRPVSPEALVLAVRQMLDRSRA